MSSSMQHEFSPGRRQLPRLHLPCTTQAPQTRAQDGTDEDWCDYCLLCTSRYFILLYYPSVKHIRTQSERQREVRQIQTEFWLRFPSGPWCKAGGLQPRAMSPNVAEEQDSWAPQIKQPSEYTTIYAKSKWQETRANRRAWKASETGIRLICWAKPTICTLINPLLSLHSLQHLTAGLWLIEAKN